MLHTVLQCNAALITLFISAFPLIRPSREAKYCDRRVCLFVCLSARMSRRPHVRISPKFLYMLPVVVAGSFSDGSVICYVLPLLRIFSPFHIIDGMGPNQRRLVFLRSFRQMAALGARSAVSDCILFQK